MLAPDEVPIATPAAGLRLKKELGAGSYGRVFDLEADEAARQALRVDSGAPLAAKFLDPKQVETAELASEVNLGFQVAEVDGVVRQVALVRGKIGNLNGYFIIMTRLEGMISTCSNRYATVILRVRGARRRCGGIKWSSAKPWPISMSFGSSTETSNPRTSWWVMI